MRLLLRSDVDGLGHKGDIVDVNDGFGRNFLVPKGLALPASKGIAAQAEAMRRSRDLRDARERESAQDVAKALVSVSVTVEAHAGEGGKLFGSVTTSDIAAAVAAQTGHELDRRHLTVAEPIKHTGTYSVVAKLHADVEFPITVEVVAG